MANNDTATAAPSEGGPAADAPASDGTAPAGNGPGAAPGPGAGQAAGEGGASTPAATVPAERLAEVESELATARGEAERLREQAMRAMADADNVRKRAERDLENAHKYALERFVNELLPVKDSLELGLAAAADGATADDIRQGTEMTARMLAAAIEKFGVKELDPRGEAFNPELHQAMTTREAGGAAPGTVLEVVQKGYLLNDRLVRPALVVVSR